MTTSTIDNAYLNQSSNETATYLTPAEIGEIQEENVLAIKKEVETDSHIDWSLIIN
ncbi:hypothetical protein [Halolactibacillus halophilus]|uniref:Uncharacterized protein n=1 Tax=Halolactibacillus halophilus TaxID=306540 RepID=A0ABQ0VJW3_9BACI|nr:hypothetical protein [Halolactibacillus halophilus]GEM01477.1 hypothetical protein HHA03_10090 [Halolactibacillus halophilus]